MEKNKSIELVIEDMLDDGRAFGRCEGCAVFVSGGAAGSAAPVAGGQGQVFLDGHVGGGALQRVLEKTADILASLEVRLGCNVPAVQDHGTGVGPESTGDGTEEGGFARTVGAQDGDKIALIQMQIYASQGGFFVDGACTEGFSNGT